MFRNYLMAGLTIALVVLTCCLFGCGDDGSVSVHLNHQVDGIPLEFNAGTYTNSAGNSYNVTKMDVHHF